MVTVFDFRSQLSLLLIRGRRCNAAGDKDAAGVVGGTLKGPLDAIVHRLHQARTEFDEQRLACSRNRMLYG